MSRLASILLVAIFSSVSWAFPLPSTELFSNQLPTNFSTNYDFEGIVALSNCSGSLIQFENSTDSDYAMVMTNGHCLGGFINPGEVIVGQPSSRSFNLMNSDGNLAGRLDAKQIVYATMTRTDMALYQLTTTYAQIKTRLKVRPFLVGSSQAGLGTPIEVVSGFWNRGYSCALEAIVHRLKEADWTFEQSMRYTRPGCEVIGGTSGSPIIESGTRKIIGINNTGNESGGRCTMNNPCEVDENGDVTHVRGYSYGQQTRWIYGCLNESRELDLNRSGCELPH